MHFEAHFIMYSLFKMHFDAHFIVLSCLSYFFLKNTHDVILLYKLSIIFREWTV